MDLKVAVRIRPFSQTLMNVVFSLSLFAINWATESLTNPFKGAAHLIGVGEGLSWNKRAMAL